MSRQTIDRSDESTREKTERVVNGRVQRVLDGIRTLGNCATSQYSMTDADKENVTNAIDKALKDLRSVYAGLASRSGGFTL